MRYWAFLSYSHDDRLIAQWLQRALERYSVPRRLIGHHTLVGAAPSQFRPIFRDQTELAADANLRAKIIDALEHSGYLIVVCSPSAAASTWVNEEIERFRSLHGAARIFSVIAGGHLTTAQADCFPPALRYRSQGEITPTDPIAVDLRPHGDGRRVARLKLIAGMLGIGLDELVKRDHQRRQRRLVIVTAAAVAGMAVMSALAVAALVARDEARQQRAHAEGLIEFMLTDLRKRLEPSGKLDLMDGAGREALEYYKAQDPSRLDAQSLARRARALRLMGEIEVQRGDLESALSSFQQASNTTSELLVRSASDPQLIFNHAQNVFWVGEIARQRGDTAAAEKQFREYRQLAQRLLELNPDADNWRAELEYSQSSLGVLFLQEGRISDAVDGFGQALTEATRLAQRNPEDLNRQIELGQGYAWLADSLEKQGHLANARSHREQELGIYKAILGKDPTLRQAKYSSIVALQVLGRLASLNGNLSESLTDFSDAAGRAEALLTDEPNNMDLTSVVAIGQVDLGEALLVNGRLNDAIGAQRRAEALITAAVEHDQSVALWQNYKTREELLKAAVAARSGQYDTALRIDESLQKSLQVKAGSESRTDPFWLLQRARLQSGDNLVSLNRIPEALETWAEVLNAYPSPIETYEPKLLLVLEGAEQRLGRADEANRIAQLLASLSQGPGGS